MRWPLGIQAVGAQRLATRAISWPTLTTSLAFLVAGVAMWQWTAIAAAQLQPSLLSLGLDPERTAVVIGTIGAGVGSAIAALIANGSISFPWAVGTFWYLLLFVIPTSEHSTPVTLPGEVVVPQQYSAAVFALVGLGCAAAGLGAAVGYGLRRIASAAFELRNRRSARQLVVAASALLLLCASGFGILRAPGILLYGPWWGVVSAATPVAQGQQVTFTYWSRAFGGYRHAVVVLPPEYSASPGLAFPVLYLLHGSPGSDSQWAHLGAAVIVGEVRAAKRLPPVVLVYPDGNGSRGGAEDHWADGYVPGDKMESDLIDDLIPSIEAHFKVVPDAKHRAIGGLSSGAYGAANLALRHPGEFGLALVFAGDLAPAASAFGGNQPALIANDPLRLALAPRPSEATAFFVGWGASDVYRAENILFAERLQQRGYEVVTDVVPGGHSAAEWRQLLLDSLEQMGGNLGPPAPA